MPDGLTLDEAKDAIRGGARFGSVFPMLANGADGETLRAFFVYGEPNANPSPGGRDLGYTGDACVMCGSLRMRRNGSCLLCEACGTTSGCS